MKNGIIIYHQDDIIINRFFIDKCLSLLNDHHYSLILIEEDQAVEYINDHCVDYVINRSRNYNLNIYLKEKNILTFNNYQTNKTANNKYLSYQLFSTLDLPCIDTYLDNKQLQFPYIKKSICGHGGQQVYLINNIKDECKDDQQYIYQPFIHSEADVRLYVLDQRFLIAVKRSCASNFRHNYKLGATISKYEPSAQLLADALKIAKYLDADYIGVDVLLVNGKYLFNEIEDPVGARMVYQISDIDIIKMLIDVIKNKLNE